MILNDWGNCDGWWNNCWAINYVDFWFIARLFLNFQIQLIAECSAAVTYRCGGRDGSWGLSVYWSLASRFDIWRATIHCERTCENGDRRVLGMTLRRDCICAVFPVVGAKNRVKHRNQLEHNIGICCWTLSCHAGRLGLRKCSENVPYGSHVRVETRESHLRKHGKAL